MPQPLPGRPRRLRVRDLLETPHLELELVAGSAGLDRRVTWTHISELAQPAQWLEGGELLLVVGLGVPRGAVGQAQYIRMLAESDAAALAVGPRVALRRQALDEATRLQFPILSIPTHIAYQAIARFVADANGDAAQRRLVTHVRILDTLRSHSEQPAGTAALLRTLEEISGYRLAVLSAAGTPLIDGSAPIPNDVKSRIPRDGSQVSLHDGWIVPVPGSGPTTAVLVALATDGADGAGLSAIRHVATVLALELADGKREREARRRVGGEILGALLSGTLPRHIDAQLGAQGLNPKGPFRLVVGASAPNDRVEDSLHHRLLDDGIAHLMLRRTELVLLCNDTSGIDGVAASLGLTLGSSDRLEDLSALALARYEARWAVERGLQDGRPGLWHFEGEESSFWLPTDFALLGDLVRRLLGPVLEYDEQHQTQLLRSLTTYFTHDRRLSTAADELHVHKHTLAYRLRRIAQLTGRDLNSVNDVSQLWLATCARRVLGDQPASD